MTLPSPGRPSFRMDQPSGRSQLETVVPKNYKSTRPPERVPLRQVATRIGDDTLRDLEEMEREEKLDRATALRKLISIGLRQWKLQRAIRLYSEGRVSTWKAAEMAELTLYEFLDELRVRRIPAQYTLEDLEEDLGWRSQTRRR